MGGGAVGGQVDRLGAGLGGQGVGERGPGVLVQQRLGLGERDPRAGGQPGGEVGHDAVDLLGRRQLGDQAQLVGPDGTAPSRDESRD